MCEFVLVFMIFNFIHLLLAVVRTIAQWQDFRNQMLRWRGREDIHDWRYERKQANDHHRL